MRSRFTEELHTPGHEILVYTETEELSYDTNRLVRLPLLRDADAKVLVSKKDKYASFGQFVQGLK
jgi:hypothetical protein